MGWVWLSCQLAICITDTTYTLATEWWFWYQPATSPFNTKHTYRCVCVCVLVRPLLARINMLWAASSEMCWPLFQRPRWCGRCRHAVGWHSVGWPWRRTPTTAMWSTNWSTLWLHWCSSVTWTSVCRMRLVVTRNTWFECWGQFSYHRWDTHDRCCRFTLMHMKTVSSIGLIIITTNNNKNNNNNNNYNC